MDKNQIKPNMIVEAIFYKYGTTIVQGKVNEVLSVPGMSNGRFIEDLPLISISVQKIVEGDETYLGYTIGVPPEDVIREV